ncbi:MAG: dsDNA nuclease domain-containing protein [Desulfobulbaceae bacterium]|nr:dsDNA nuclease domain-containing protein [Desulfobulbaceae bacterium]
MDVIDPQQLKLIEAVHRGFLYQHLYAVGCMIKLATKDSGQVSVERDEDVEISTSNVISFIQIKTRKKALIKSDINTALQRFNELRLHYEVAYPEKSISFVVVSNQKPGPKLTTALDGDDWPKDVSVIWPDATVELHDIAPPAWRSLDEAVAWCIKAAEDLPFSTLSPETLVWKLAARVQYASTGEDDDRRDHCFRREDLPVLFEQLVEQLQEFPAVPEDYRPQQDEPALLTEAPVRMIVGFSGAGKTVWASWQARHSSSAAVYFDVGDLPGNALAGSLARELAARFLGSGAAGAAQLPAASGLELLQALNNRIDLPEPPLVVIDNVHRIDAEAMREIVLTCSKVRLILIAQPWQDERRLEALLGITAEKLNGWNEDTIASVFAEEGAKIAPETAIRWRNLTSGMPLYVKNAAFLCVNHYGGDAKVFADQVEKGDHAEELAQEAILRFTIDALSDNEALVAAALSISSVKLSGAEIIEYLCALPSPPARPNAALRSLQRKGIVQVYANGMRKLHDAMRLSAASLIDRFSAKDLLALQTRLRDILHKSLLQKKDLARFGTWLRLLPSTGQVETLVDLATTEYFHEVGEPSDLKAILLATANDTAIDAELRFWTLDALAFWEFQDGNSPDLFTLYVERMGNLFEKEGSLGDRERAALITKQMIIAGLERDRFALDALFEKESDLWKNDRQLSRIVRYNYAITVHRCGFSRDALSIAEILYAEYYDVLGLHPNDIIGASTARIISLLPGGLAAHQDNLKHLADCLNLAAMCLREGGLHPGLAVIHAAKFFAASGSYRSAMKAAQDVSDDFIAIGDAIGARQTMEEHVLPMLQYFQFSSSNMDVRGQYAVILAYCGEYDRARAEMAALVPYAGTLSTEHQEGFAKQQQLIEEVAQGRVHLTPCYKLPKSTPRAQRRRSSRKIDRNAPSCPCGSGKKYKKCCLRA